MDDIAARKRALMAERAAELHERKRIRRGHRGCFWTWPWGHRWKKISDGYGSTDFACVGCDKRVTRWYM